MLTRRGSVLGLVVALVGVGALALAEERSDVVYFQGPPEFGGHEGAFVMAHGFEGKVVKGAPYSGEAVTEIVQTLADGNRIVRKTTAAVARDSEGRTRREHTLGAIGPVIVADKAPHLVFIHDPVAGVSYVLDVDSREARKLPPLPRRASSAEGEARPPADAVEVAPPPPPGTAAVPLPPMRTFTRRLPKPETEALGRQTIEGIDAEGTRETIAIPAGEIGNEKEIRIVSERWYSPELQTVVMSRRSDPRLGETTYRLTGINRAEPDKALFEVPQGFTLKEGPPERGIRHGQPEVK
jgi:hypothetical protein